tara:strand:- start:182367 stop:183392 length:1026 start_codon:yes stop_codon:yes gene_type:complete
MRQKVTIIAEAGVNHNGDILKAKQLIDVAVEAGVDMVKFQTFKAEDLVSKAAKKAEYQNVNIGDNDDSQFNMLKKLELSDEQHKELIAYCEKKGIRFFSTAFDVKGLDYLNSLNFDSYKIPSGEITNYPYLKRIGSFGKPVILSTGMADMEEIKAAIEVICSSGLNKDNVTVLHCNTEYPTPMEDVNLKAMLSIKDELNVAFGYSDHTLGIEVPIAAVALGATVIEKHFTLDRNLPGPDHKASLEPSELKAMVSGIRNIEKAISGDGVKKASPSEAKNKAVARKSIHLAKDVQKGHVLVSEDLIALRPGSGISPMMWNDIIGKTVANNFSAFHCLSQNDIK